ncbi:MAG TPA: hypothetical protein VJ903_04900, partial [Clostridia bacterium]|nr:hypothetical protein [Clostridia bacterium]
THLTEFLQTNAMNIFSDIFDQENSEVMQAAFPKALELFLAELEKEFVIGTPRLEGIQELSAYDFVTGETNPITDQDRETVIFCNLIGKIFEYIDISRSILEAIDALYLSDFEQSDNQIYISQNATLELAALLYINSIDIEYLYAYNENLEALKSTSYADTTPFSKENYLTFASLLIDSLYNEDITNITNTINQLLLSYASGKGQLANTEDNLEIINNFTSKILDVLELCAEHLLDISQPHILQYNNLLSITTIVDGDGKAVNVREAIIAAANDVLTLLTGDGKNVLDIYIKNALYLSFDNATSIWYNLLTLEEFTVKDAELVGYLQTIYNLIDNGFDLHKVITSTIAALNEFNTNELSNEINSTIFKAKIIAGIFGEDASSVINLVYPNETLRQLTNEFLAIYDDILILASYDYGEQSDDFNTALNNFNAFISAH